MAPDAGTVVLLNGTPSAGKTTLGRALVAEFPEPAFFLSLDDFTRAVPDRHWLGPQVRDRFPVMRDAWLAMLHDIASRGLHVIAESIAVAQNVDQYDRAFGDLRVLLVGVTCPLEIVHEREATREGRRNGPERVTAEEVAEVHRHDYPVEVDTAAEPTTESVRRIIACWTALTTATDPEPLSKPWRR